MYKRQRRDGELGREDKLDNEHVKTMIESNRWELGAHTETHAYLPALPLGAKRREIEGGKRKLAETFGVQVNSFAYPFGDYEREDVDLVRTVGFTSAVTTQPGIATDVSDERFEIRRIKVTGQDNMFVFRMRLQTGFRGVRG